MRIQRNNKIITATIIVLSVFAIGCALWSRHYRLVQEQAYEERRKMFNFSEQLARGNDRLTSPVLAIPGEGHQRHGRALGYGMTVVPNLKGGGRGPALID